MAYGRWVRVCACGRWQSQGLVMPPRVAPTQVVLIPITTAQMTPELRAALDATVKQIMDGLKGAGLRAVLDDRDNYRPGWKYNHWEVKVMRRTGLLLHVLLHSPTPSQPALAGFTTTGRSR